LSVNALLTNGFGLKHQKSGAATAVMLEKAIVALQLLGHLAETGLPIQFKGRTSYA
jgi:hypothetical protein